MFAKHAGIAERSLNEVAAEAGVSKPTLYNYFERQGLPLSWTCCAAWKRGCKTPSREAVQDPKQTAREKVLAALQVQFDFARNNGELIKAAHTAMFLPDGIKRADEPPAPAADALRGDGADRARGESSRVSSKGTPWTFRHGSVEPVEFGPCPGAASQLSHTPAGPRGAPRGGRVFQGLRKNHGGASRRRDITSHEGIK